MSFPSTNAWYVSSVGYAAITAWATGATIAAGALRRPTAPSVGNERIVVAIVGGTTHATTEPSWTTSRGAKNTDNTVTWQEVTGNAAVNGDLTNTVPWSNAQIKNTALTQGVIIKDGAGTHLFILSTAGTAGNGAEPTWNVAAVGNTTADNTCTWTYIGLASSFTGGIAPHARLANALAANWGVAGQNIFVKSDHSETQSSAITLANSSSTPFYVLGHDGGAYPPLSANLVDATSVQGGLITCSGVAAIDITALRLYCHGLEFKNTGTNNVASWVQLGDAAANGCVQRFKNCKITLAGSDVATTNNLCFGTNSSTLAAPRIYMDNCVVSFNFSAQGLRIRNCSLEWVNTPSALTGTAVNQLASGSNASSFNALLRGVDLSLLGSGKTLFGGGLGGMLTLQDCKLGTSVAIGTPDTPSYRINLNNCDSGAVNYRNEVYDFFGTLTTETTIVRSGGASDGTTPVSGKIVTTSSALWATPFDAPPIAIWNETVGSAITITLFGIWGGGAVPNNDDFWIDVDYQGSTLTPIASRSTSGKANILASNAALTSDSSTWGGSTTAFKTSVTITPQQKGYIFVTPRMAKASTTLYYDPKLNVA